jgi:hypothetical protein
MSTKKLLTEHIGKTGLFTSMALGAVFVAGCEPRTEKVLDIETPGTDIEVHKEVDPEPEPPKKVIDIEAPGTDVEVNKTDNDGDAKVRVND